MPAQQIIDKALKSGYSQVSKIEADDGRWEGKGTKNGQKIDALSGRIVFGHRR
jgi:Peptidase propeptide and YPEB domain